MGNLNSYYIPFIGRQLSSYKIIKSLFNIICDFLTKFLIYHPKQRKLLFYSCLKEFVKHLLYTSLWSSY
jgi:hypothetical protein